LYFITILDCLRGLRKAIDFEFIHLETFNIQDYLFREKVENGDMNWIIPGKFLAFAGPDDEVYDRHAMVIG
jgi:cell division cycle 14